MACAGPWPGTSLDFDDLHMPSTAHVSAICVPASLATGGGARAYLAGRRMVMARLGTAYGLAALTLSGLARHLQRPGHRPAAARSRPWRWDCPPTRSGRPSRWPFRRGRHGVQRAFGTDAKSLQVGFAVDRRDQGRDALAAAGAQAPIRPPSTCGWG